MAAVFGPRSHGAAQDRDEAEIRAVQTRQAEAWNRHDAKAYAELFEDDGDVVNVVGWWWKGRAEIEGKLTAAFAGVFRESTLTITEVAGAVPDPGDRRGARPLDDDRGPDAAAPPGAARRHPDPDPAQDRGPVADLGVPEHERGARDAVPHGAAGHARVSAAKPIDGASRTRGETRTGTRPAAGRNGARAYGFGAGFDSFLVARALPSAAEAWGFQNSGS